MEMTFEVAMCFCRYSEVEKLQNTLANKRLRLCIYVAEYSGRNHFYGGKFDPNEKTNSSKKRRIIVSTQQGSTTIMLQRQN